MIVFHTNSILSELRHVLKSIASDMCCIKFQLKIESQKDDDNGVFPESVSHNVHVRSRKIKVTTEYTGSVS